MIYRVRISGYLGSYVERWDGESAEDAERKARQRWQREFGDAGAFNFHASEARELIRDDEEVDDDN